MGCGQTSGLDHIYSKELLFDKDKSTQNSSQTYVNSKVTDYDEVEKNYYKQTYLEKLMNNFTTYKDNNCLGYRKIVSPGQWEDKFTFLKYGEVKIFSQNFIHNLKLLNLVEPFDFGPDEGFHKFFGIYSKNSVEWLVSDFACQMDSITVVTLYNTLGDAAFEHIFKQTLLQTICISPENIKNLLKFKEKFGINTLKNVILFDLTNTLTSEEIDTLQKNNLKVFKFTDLIKPVSTGDKTEIILTPPNPETISTICYTSGTTNLPKGAKISQRAISSQMSILQDSGVNLSSSDIHLSYLPLAHIMERVGTSLVLYVGGSIGFISGDVRKTLTEDCKSLHPTFFFAVPKVLANFRDTIMQKMSQVTGCKRYMIDRALRVKKENYDENNSINHCIYDSSVFSKIHAEFGGKWRFIITGSAPLPIDLGVEIKIIFGCPIVEGYGMTEVAGASHCTHFTDNVNGYVGGPITPSKIKLFDVPELNYTSETKTKGVSTPCGEVCVKGPNVFSGYFCDKENTSKIIDSDGWLHTGDIAMLSTDQKKFKIVDRVKEIFKLVQGEYIAPSKLEMVYSKCEYVSQICVYGQSVKTYIIAIMTPKKHEIEKWLKENNILKEGENPEIYYENPELHAEIKKSLDKLANANSFNSLEKVQKIIISKIEFTIDNELLTPTAKLVRRKIENMFRNEIDKIYI